MSSSQTAVYGLVIAGEALQTEGAAGITSDNQQMADLFAAHHGAARRQVRWP